MTLPTLYGPALAQISAKWPTLSEATRSNLINNLPSLEERLAALEWNARLAAMAPQYNAACQAVYDGLMAWDSLSDLERVVVFMAGMGPVSQKAASLGLIGGIPASH